MHHILAVIEGVDEGMCITAMVSSLHCVLDHQGKVEASHLPVPRLADSVELSDSGLYREIVGSYVIILVGLVIAASNIHSVEEVKSSLSRTFKMRLGTVVMVSGYAIQM